MSCNLSFLNFRVAHFNSFLPRNHQACAPAGMFAHSKDAQHVVRRCVFCPSLPSRLCIAAMTKSQAGVSVEMLTNSSAKLRKLFISA